MSARDTLADCTCNVKPYVSVHEDLKNSTTRRRGLKVGVERSLPKANHMFFSVPKHNQSGFDLVCLDETRAAVTKHQYLKTWEKIVLDEEDVRKYSILWYNNGR